MRENGRRPHDGVHTLHAWRGLFWDGRDGIGHSVDGSEGGVGDVARMILLGGLGEQMSSLGGQK